VVRKKTCGLALVVVGALAGPAAAGRLDFSGEVRADANLGFGSTGQFGTLDGNGPCGYNPSTDGGGDLSATVAALLSSPRYRHQLTVSLGYYALYCTPLLRRPVGGFDYRGEHTLTDRTRLSASARYTFDVFDRSFDALSGAFTAGLPAGSSSGESAGLPYLIGQASVELTHAFSKVYGLRAGVQLHSLEVLGALTKLPYYSTLGPMEAVAFHVTAARDSTRSRLELGLRYQVSAYYSATWLGIRQRGQVPAAHDVQLAPAWEYKLSPKLTLHVEAGAAVAVQPQLCVALDDLLIAADRCSIDARAPGVRGYEGAPPVEAQLGRRATLAPVGEVSLSYSAPRRRFELHLARGYEPDAYAGALSLYERLSGNLHVRPSWPLLLHGNAQLVHSAQTSPARVTFPLDGLLLQPLSPQNRTLWMAMGLFGVDYQIVKPLSVFFETTFQALKIRGERVPQIPSQGTNLTAELMAFPMGSGQSYQDIYRVNLLLGVRGYLDTLPSARREAELFTETRAVP
jgi:hypothetical protein